MSKTATLLRARAVVTTAGDCTCEYDDRLGIGWTCDGCLPDLDAALAVDWTVGALIAS